MGNRITPYKDRKINYKRPVSIYRNLTSKKQPSYSIRQNGLVVAHTDAITLENAKFIVQKKGQARVIATKRKNIHAYIKGTISQNGSCGTTAILGEKCCKNALPAVIQYDPYKGIGFYCKNLTKTGFEVKSARAVIINKKGVFAAYVN